MTHRREAFLWVLPAVVLLAIFSVYPPIFSIKVSLSSAANYTRLFQDRVFLVALFQTAVFACAALLAEFLLGLGLAVLVDSLPRGRGIFRAGLLVPMLLPPVVAAVVWRLIFNPQFGVLNGTLRMAGIDTSSLTWTSGERSALLSVVLVDIWQWTPFVFLLLSAGLQAVPKEPLEAAEIDGASGWRRLTDITLPLLRPTIVLVLLLRAIDLVRIFDQIFILTQGGPGTATETVSLYIYRTAFRFANFGYAAVMSFVCLGLTTLFAKALLRSFGRELTRMNANRIRVYLRSFVSKIPAVTLPLWLRYGLASLALLAALAPVWWLIGISLKREIDQFAWPPLWFRFQPTLAHYREAFSESFGRYFLNSVTVALLSTAAALLLGVPAAYALARFEWRRGLGDKIGFWILSTRMLPPIVTIVPLFLMMRTLGLLNTLFGLVLIYTAFNLPFVVWMMRGFFADIPRELEEAAMLDGASRASALLRIVLPVAAPALAATAVFCLIAAWNEFLFALVLTQTETATTLPVGIASRVTQYEIKWGVMSAAGVTAMLPVLAFSAAAQRYLVRGLSLGAVKG